MQNNNNEVVKEIKEQVRLSDLISQYVKLTFTGGKGLGLCPFHTEKTPSFNVNDDDGFYKCFGCGKGGDHFTFLMEKENYSFPEALKILAGMAGIKLQDNRKPLTEFDKKKNELYDLYTRVAGSFSDILLNKENASIARDYLVSRNFTLETIKEFQLGYLPQSRDWLWNFLKKKNYSDSFLQESGLFSKKGNKYCYFTDRLIFPVKNKRGQVIAFSGRQLRGDKGPKYINSPETPIYQKRDALFGLFQASADIRRSESVYIVEGNFDVLAMYQSGVKNCVAPLGTAFTPTQVALINQHAKKFYCLFDNDNAGVNAAKKTIFMLQDLKIPSYVIEVPIGKDPSDIMEKEGSVGIKNLIKKIQNSLDYLLKTAILQYGKDSVESKEEIIKFILPYVNKYESEIRKTEALRFIAQQLDIDFIALQKDVVKQQQKVIPTQPKPLKQSNRKTLLPDKELLLLVAASKEANYFEMLKKQININNLNSVYAKALYQAIDDCFKNGTLNANEILLRISDEDFREQVAIWINDNNFIQDPEKTLNDIIYKIRIERLEAKKNQFLLQLTSQNSEENTDNKTSEIIEEIEILNYEIKKIKGEV